MSAAWLLRRLGAILLVLLVVSFTVFGIMQLLPGNAAVMVLGEFATADKRHAIELTLGLDHPWWQQYLHWLGGIARGDWGMSIGLARPVTSLIGTALGRSGVLAGATLVTVCVIAIPIGAAGALVLLAGPDGGYAGFHDQVNTHFCSKIGNALLISIAGAGVQLSQGTGQTTNGYNSQQIAAAALGQQFGELGQEYARAGLAIPNTLEIRPGYRFMVMVNKDVVFR